MVRCLARTVWLCLLTVPSVFAQDLTGAIEGAVTNKTAGVVATAHVVAKNLATGFSRD